ncbi:MAG: PAS domain-containing protein, partial [Eubacteriales bacterium]|nr:PAS domain-containing protein [Eubacteriales bacterium]
VMWSVDGEIRNELADLDENKNHDETWNRRVQAVLTRAEEMIYKEANILFPICAVNFTKEEWYEIYRDNKDYAPVFGVEELWKEAESYLSEREAKNESAMKNGEIVLAGGHMTLAQLEAMLNTLPIEISFIDVDNINRYFNEGPKVFKRPKMALDREVFSCHPPKVEPMVRSILSDFRNNRTDSVPVWMEKNGKPFLVTYMAVRDKKGGYLGTVEVVQNMEAAEKHFKGQNESLENL